MRFILKCSSYAGLGLCLIPALLCFYKVLSFSQHKNLMFIGTLVWFFTAPFWIDTKKSNGK